MKHKSELKIKEGKNTTFVATHLDNELFNMFKKHCDQNNKTISGLMKEMILKELKLEYVPATYRKVEE